MEAWSRDAQRPNGACGQRAVTSRPCSACAAIAPGRAAACGRRIGRVVSGADPTGPLTRRRFLGLAAGAALSTGGLDRLSRGVSTPIAGAVLREPRRLRSRGGILALTLQADEREAFVAGALRRAIVYNGSFPGPTLVVDPGDRIRITLVNRLERPDQPPHARLPRLPRGQLRQRPAAHRPRERLRVPVRPAARSRARAPTGTTRTSTGTARTRCSAAWPGAVIFRSRAERRRALPPMRDRVLVLQAPEWDEAGAAQALVPGPARQPAAVGQRAAEPPRSRSARERRSAGASSTPP